MDDMVQTPEAQRLAQLLQQQQMQKFLQQMQPAQMYAQPNPQGEFTQQAAPMLGQPMGGMGARPAPMPYAKNPSGLTAQEYEMMRKMYR